MKNKNIRITKICLYMHEFLKKNLRLHYQIWIIYNEKHLSKGHWLLNIKVQLS